MKMEKTDWNLSAKISDTYDEKFYKEKESVENRLNIRIVLVSVSTNIVVETEVEMTEWCVHDGKADITFIHAEPRGYMSVKAFYKVDRQNLFITSMFDFRDSVELGDVIDKVFNDMEIELTQKFTPTEPLQDKEGEQ